MRELVDVHYPDADCIRVVQDNLSTHSAGALYEAFAPAEARRILRRLEFHYTPKHASWLNMVEIEIGVLRGQCLDRRIDDPERLISEIAAWEKQRNAAGAASNGCSQPTRPAPKWVAPIPSRPKSHNHCAEVLVVPHFFSRQAKENPVRGAGFERGKFSGAHRDPAPRRRWTSNRLNTTLRASR
jgi:hypothetical protein